MAGFDWDVVKQAVMANAPTQIALHGADYINHDNYGAIAWTDLTDNARRFVDDLELKTGCASSFCWHGTNKRAHHRPKKFE